MNGGSCIIVHVGIIMLWSVCTESDMRVEQVVGREQGGTRELVNNNTHILTILTHKINTNPRGVGYHLTRLDARNMSPGSSPLK